MIRGLAAGIAGILAAGAIASGFFYPETGIVTALDRESDVVEVTTANGHVFGFCGVEDWESGDLVSMLMNSRGTDLVFDDEIVRVRYAGRISDYTPSACAVRRGNALPFGPVRHE